MGHDFVVEKVHIQRKLVINLLEIERGHITHNALQRSIYIDSLQQEIWINSTGISWLPPTVMLGLAYDADRFATFMCILIGHNLTGIETNFCI